MKKKLALFLALILTLSISALPASALELEDAKDLLQQYYVDEIPEEILAMDSLEEILEALGDPYTSYMSADEYQSFLESVNGTSVVGIGVSMQTAFDNGYRIMSILDDSPAQEAGLEAGDRIVAVDGITLTSDMDVRGVIGGESGTAVTITVIRQSDGQQKDYTMTRRAVVIPIVTYEQYGDAGIIDCTSFGDSTISTIQEALETLNEEVSIWIIDLRSNPGGTSNAAAGSAGLFAGSQVMVYFRNADGHYSYVYTSSSCPDLTDKPLIVLTSPYSASGSELFAAAARDHGFGIAIGQRTFGKGIAQIAFDEDNTQGIFDGDTLKITAYRFFSPDGTTNHIVGVLPTLLVSPENTFPIALLLSAPEPERANGFLKLELAGHTFYLDLDAARAEENIAAFTELLEALPPAAKLYQGSGAKIWTEIQPDSLAAKLKLTGYASRCAFPDLTDDLAEKEQIETLACYGLVAGYEDGRFHPQDTITRAQFCTLLANALNLPASDKSSFSDVSAGAWYAPYVSAMASKGFIAGCGDGTFQPDAAITYQEAVTILSSVASWLSMDGYALSQETLTPQDWTKYYEFADWAQAPARNLTELGVTLDLSQPTAPATRAQAAGLLYQLMEATHLLWDSAAQDQ